LRDDPDNWRGELNDIFNVFFQSQPAKGSGSRLARSFGMIQRIDSCHWFMPSRRHKRMATARLRTLHLAGYIL